MFSQWTYEFRAVTIWSNAQSMFYHIGIDKKNHKAVLFPFFHEASTLTNLLIPTPYVEVTIDFCFLWKYVKLAMKWVWEKGTK